MSTTPTPRNRRERRAAAKEDTPSSTTTSSSFPTIELKKPDYDAPRAPGHKTLYEIAEERQAELQASGFYDKYEKDPVHDAGDHQFWTGADDAPIGPAGEALVWSTSLAMLHFTLDVLVWHQYRQEIIWPEIWKKTFTILPALFMVIWFLKTATAMRWKWTRQVFFFGLSVVAGCYLLHSGNKDGYYAVMKRAPPVGTLWVWSCIEMDLYFALAHVGIVGFYMWWNGYSSF